jgi:hypothetical protein
MMLKVFMRFGFWWMNIIFKTVNGFMIHEILPKSPRGGGYLPFYCESFFSRLDRGIGFSYWTFISPIWMGIFAFLLREILFPLGSGYWLFLWTFISPFGWGFAFLLKEILFPLGSGCWLFLLTFISPIGWGYLPFY